RSFEVDASSRMLNFCSLAFDPAVMEIFVPLFNGGVVHVPLADEVLPGPELLELLRERRISHLAITASALAQHPVGDLPLLRTVIAGGEACPLELPRRWAEGRT